MLIAQAVTTSLRWGVPQVIIGATIVSLGTTLPEASVSVFAAIQGNPDLALGNAIGSIIANASLIIGFAALLGKVPVDKNAIQRQGNLQFYLALLLIFFSLPMWVSGSGGLIHQWMGFILVSMLLLYLYLSIKWSKQSSRESLENQDDGPNNTIRHLLLLAVGMSLVIASSKILIPTVEIIAYRIGIPQSIVAATLVAFGTSLPELITAITAVRKGHGGLAVGNIVGANVLNILFVVGLSASVTKQGLFVPIEFYKLQFPAMLIILIAFRIFANNWDQQISKKEGAVLAALYVVYIVLSYTIL